MIPYRLEHLAGFLSHITLWAYNGFHEISYPSVTILGCSGALSCLWLVREWQLYCQSVEAAPYSMESGATTADSLFTAG